MRSAILALLLSSTIAAGGCAARTHGPGEAAPQARAQQAAGVDLHELETRMDAGIGAHASDGPGGAVLVLSAGRVVAQREFGLASLEHGVPFTADHVVRIPYSEGREFLAIAALFQVHDGLLRMDDSVRTHFPELPAWAEPIRVRDLVHHHSGLVDEWSALLLMHESMGNRVEVPQFLRLLAEQPAPEVEPRSGYLYSNSDYGLLRLILERACGEDLGEYMQRRMFGPLHMRSTHLVGDFSEVIPRHAVLYAPYGDGYRHADIKTSPGGDYVIATTANDLARWAAAHADTTSEVCRAVAGLMDGATPIPGLQGHYAFGHTVAEMAGRRVVRHEGVLGCNYLTRVPELGLAVITFGNGYYEPEQNRALVDVLLGRRGDGDALRFPTEAVHLPADLLASYAGRYVSTNIPSWERETSARELILLEVVGGRLELALSWGRVGLVPVAERAFTWNSGWGEHGWGLMLEFGDPRDSGPQELVLRYSDGQSPEEYARVEG